MSRSRFAVSGNFNDTLTSFMLLVAYWLGPYSIILIIEHFVYRHGRYNVDDWNTQSAPSWLGCNSSMVFGLLGAGLVLLRYSQYVNPITGL